MTRIFLGKQKLAGGGVWGREIYRHGRILERQADVWQCAGVKASRERERAGNEIILPQVGDDCCDCAADMQHGVAGHGVVHRESRAPTAPVLVVGWLRVVQENLFRVVIPVRDVFSARVNKLWKRGAILRLMNAAVYFVTQSVVESQA